MSKKYKIILILIMFCFQSTLTFSQKVDKNYNLFYIDLSGFNNRIEFKWKIQELLTEVMNQGDSFLVFLSKDDRYQILTKKNQINNSFYSQLLNVRSSSISSYQHIQPLINYWSHSNTDITYVDKSDYTFCRYNKLFFNYFIPFDRLITSDLSYEYIIDRLLTICNISPLHSNAECIKIILWFEDEGNDNERIVMQNKIKSFFGNKYELSFNEF